jgi:protein SCO1
MHLIQPLPRSARALLATLASTGALVLAAHAQNPSTVVPRGLQDVNFNQMLDAQVDPALQFRDTDGRVVSLGDSFGKRPLILALVYYECPMMCNLTLNGLLDVVKEMSLKLGDDYGILTVSFNPAETHVLAARKRENYLAQLPPTANKDGWRFLVGNEPDIRALTSSVGFEYKYVAETGDYAHRAGLIVLTPEGRVSRYLPGMQFEERQVRLSLVEASKSRIGTLSDQLFLLCHQFDPTTGKYSLIISRVVNLACGLTLLTVSSVILVFFIRERRAGRPQVARA